jgi:hypothetical protein
MMMDAVMTAPTERRPDLRPLLRCRALGIPTTIVPHRRTTGCGSPRGARLRSGYRAKEHTISGVGRV